MAASEWVRALCESHGQLTAYQLGEGFYAGGRFSGMGRRSEWLHRRRRSRSLLIGLRP
jgi:hypothetical protein